MTDDPRSLLETHRDAFRQILREAHAARSALCENELIIRLGTIVALAEKALEQGGRDT
ncbi:hypothetical protein M2352_003301 [Azospirillum fermentarium]|uniref:hypothetical protein n=1 Tax=Azospirillum fermentarium TaxID=1233114 RepID=UPI002226F8E0|nr:hypothetical protein [Azospirillum fermentarium]MCW2247667.1 hypothetical protein [Azospirillum fermentarium]